MVINPLKRFIENTINLGILPIWGAIAGGAASALVGGLMGGGGGGGSTQTSSRTPYAVGTPLMGVSWDGGSPTWRMDPRVRQFGDVFLNQAMQQAGQIAPTDTERAFGGQLQQAGRGFLTQAMQQQPSGMGAIGAGLSPVTAGRGAFGLAAPMMERATTFDPFGAAEEQFQRMESILAPGRERAREAQEARLFAQGRLGSTGGSLEQQALGEAQEQSRRAQLVEALGQAQGIQRQAADIGLGIGGFGLQQQLAGQQRAGQLADIGFGMERLALQRPETLAKLGMTTGAFGATMPLEMQQARQQLATGAFGAAMMPQQQMLDVYRTGISGGGSTTQATRGPGLGAQIGSGLIGGGMDLIGQGIQGAFNPPTTQWGTTPGSQQSQMLAEQW